MNIYIFDGQRPSLQQQYAILGLFCKLAFVAAGVDRRKEPPTRKTGALITKLILFFT